MSLEDEFSDVVAKAMAGLEMDCEELAKIAGVTECEISGLLHGDMDEGVVWKIAPSLGLDAEAVISLPSYRPADLSLPGVRRIEVPYRQWTVNAWLIEKNGKRILLDTGYGANDVAEAISGVKPDVVLITHAHEDHVGGNAALLAKDLRIISEVEAMKPGILGVRRPEDPGGRSLRSQNARRRIFHRWTRQAGDRARRCDFRGFDGQMPIQVCL